jgi:glycosyltransferase involved in cell wall biosynthesis
MSLDAGELRAAATAAPAVEIAADSPPAIAPADPHRALRPLIEAASHTQARTAVLPVPMLWQGWPWLPGRLEVLIKALLFLAPHARLAGQIWRRRDHDLIVVREFLTVLLLIVWPLIWPLRRRVYFLINHNLQEAHRRRLERSVLRLLYRTGCRFACFETTAGCAEIGIVPDAERFLVLPHPLAGAIVTRPAPSSAAEPVVGVIGAVRTEKGSEVILQTLLQLREQGRMAVRLVLGCPEAVVRAAWQCRGFEVIDTTSRAAYLAALDLCDVVILNYQRERYLYRPSGVAADALSRGAAVVCPDFPLMRLQLSAPATVGAVFDGLDGLPAATMRALALRPTLGDALAAHQRARDPGALARLLDAFVAGTLGRRRSP